MVPEIHDSATDMARCLATYINDPVRIRAEVSTVWSALPSVHVIKQYRAQYVARKQVDPNDYDRTVISSDKRYADAMEAASAALLDRIFASRRAA